MFADDRSFSYQSNNISQLNEVINEDPKRAEKWLNGNKLSLNILKTHSMLISTKPKHKTLERSNESLMLKIRENELESVQKTKYLGVQIDNALGWKGHCNGSAFLANEVIAMHHTFYLYKSRRNLFSVHFTSVTEQL